MGIEEPVELYETVVGVSWREGNRPFYGWRSGQHSGQKNDLALFFM